MKKPSGLRRDMTSELADAFRKLPTLTRTGPDSVEIAWEFAGKPVEVRIFRGESPGTIDRKAPLARTRKHCVAIAGLNPEAASYFELVPQRGRAVIVGERRPLVEGCPNLRDLGGYEATDGRRAKWGLIFRSSNLGRLTDKGCDQIRRLGIKTVCDFRTKAEALKLPNRFPDSEAVDYVQLPIQHGDFEPTIVFDRIRKGDYDWISEDFMLQGYIESMERYPEVWVRLFKLMTDPRNRPLLFHCTGGKDRTGVAAALILLSLGVPEETVIEDYGLSDGYNAEVRRRINDDLRPLGVDISKVAPYFTAPESRIRAFLKYIDGRYGSAVDYLVRKAGVSEALLKRLKEDLLE